MHIDMVVTVLCNYLLFLLQKFKSLVDIFESKLFFSSTIITLLVFFLVALERRMSTKKSSIILCMGCSFKFMSVLCFVIWMDVAGAYEKLPNGNGETEASSRVGSFGGVIDDMDKFLRHPNKQCGASQAELDAARLGGYGIDYRDHHPLLEKTGATHTRTLVECKRLCMTTTHCKAFEFRDGGTYTTDAKQCGLFYACRIVGFITTHSEAPDWSGGSSYVMQDTTKRINAIKQYGPIVQWDLSEVTNLKYAFYQTALNPDISRWVVSTVTDMHGSK